MAQELSKELAAAVELLRTAELDARDGLTEELFWTISALVPIANVDLLISNQEGQLLLARRNDAFYQKSWHIPGGCMRYGETFAHRIQETARRELGCYVEFDPEPLAVRNILRGSHPGQEHPLERGHNVAILFRCRLPEDYKIQNGNLTENDDGYLKWFNHLPEDFIEIQRAYSDCLTLWN